MKKDRHERAKRKLKGAVKSALDGGANPSDGSWKNYNKLLGRDYTIEMGWRLFRTQVIPPDASVIQVDEMKKAYMAGFTECFKVMTDYCDELSEDEAMRFLSRINNEATAIVDRMLAQHLKGPPPCP